MQHRFAHGGVVLRIARQHVPQGIPGTQVGPARVHRHHAGGNAQFGARGQPLHHGIVDRIRWAGRKHGGVGAHKVEVAHRAVHGRTASFQNIGAADVQGLQPHAGAHQKQAAVPEVVTPVQIGLRRHGVGLLGKTGDQAGAVGVVCALLHIAVTRFRAVGHNTKSQHGCAPCGNGHRLLHRCVQRGTVSNHMVCWHHQQQRVCPTGLRLQRCQGQRGCGVAPHRLQHDARGRQTHRLQLAGRQEAVFGVAHHQGGQQCGVGQPLQAQRRVLQHGVFALQRQKLLGIRLTRQWPEAGAGATTQDDGQNLRGGHGCFTASGAAWSCARSASRMARR